MKPLAYPTHRVLFSQRDGRINAAMDCFSGLIVRAFSRPYDIGELVESGPITLYNDKTKPSVERKFWVVTGYSDWRVARAMADKSTSSYRSLAKSGIWHEVISE